MSTTVQEIINYADRKFPNQETDTNKISDLNVVYNELFNDIEKLTDNFQIYEAYTIANQATYGLPTRCKIYNVTRMVISQDTNANINASTKWDEAEYAGLGTEVGNGVYFGRVSDDTFCLFKDGIPFVTTDLVIKIYYYKVPKNLVDVTDEIELDKRYTSLLKYLLIVQLASQGRDPDSEIADYYQIKYEEELKKVKDDLASRLNEAPAIHRQVQEVW